MVTLPDGFPSDLIGAFNVLKTHAELSLEDLGVLAMIEAAGEEFYLRIAKGVHNTEAKALLTRNGREERGHARRLVKAIAAQNGTAFVLPAAEHNPFIASMPDEMPATVEFLRMLEEGEQEGDLQYQAWADAASHPTVAKLLRDNGREETRHGARDARVIQLLTASN